jgi:hypothetical protein
MYVLLAVYADSSELEEDEDLPAADDAADGAAVVSTPESSSSSSHHGAAPSATISSEMAVRSTLSGPTATNSTTTTTSSSSVAALPGVVRPGIVHRLDRGTSGLMVVAKDDLSHARLCQQFKERTVSYCGHLLALPCVVYHQIACAAQ